MVTDTMGIDDDGLGFDRLDEALDKITAMRRKIDATRSAPHAQAVNKAILAWWRAELMEISGNRSIVQIASPGHRMRIFW